MNKPNILIQLDSDAHASAFDAVVALDAGVDQLLQYGAVSRAAVRSLVHGAIFTRGPRDLSHTAIFIGGSNVAAGAELLREVCDTFIGPMRVSVLLDANGANTTAAAAVLSAARHVRLADATATILAATGPVGQRAALLLARAGAKVIVTSRRVERAQQLGDTIRDAYPSASIVPRQTPAPDEASAVIRNSQLVIAAGAAGTRLLARTAWTTGQDLKAVIDLNAVPPAGIEGVEPGDCGIERGGCICFGAIGVGGLKMKIHKQAIRRLFESTEHVLDAEQIYDIGHALES